ncbi:hypothetical protein [Paenibacillus sinopodophylli]|uniref:hypothetical protein n=1 Tax=Paenibacillus sinopodophylli TaxID=1837342 RepID=UPI00110CE52E|nr:hypothetical protein [Paenibacillus sinopodophylli]
MAVMSAAQVAAELQRKKNLGIAPTSAANQAQYDTLKPMSAAQASAPLANAATSTSAPSTGFGGATYGTSGAANQAISANQAKLASDPTFKQDEITRTQNVIATNKAQGLDTTAQEKYLTTNLGYTAPQQAIQTSSGGYMPNDAVTSVQNSGQLQQQATDATATERAALLNAINTQMSSLKNNAAYSNQLIQDNRTLEDQALLRNKNPFSGATNYQLSQVQRGRSIDDTSRASQLDNTLNSLSTEIANFDKLTPERQRAIYQELLAAERTFGLNVGQLTGNYAGQRTLAGGAQDWSQAMDLANQTGNLPNGTSASGSNSGNNYGMNQLSQLGGTRTLQGQAMDLQNKQANQDTAFQYMDRFGQLVNPQSDWSGYGRQVAAGGQPQTLQGQQVASGLISEQQNRELATRQSALQEWQTTGAATPAVSAILGVPIGTPTSDQSYRQASLTLDQDKFKYSQWADAAKAGEQKTVNASTAGDMLSQALQKVVGTDEDGKVKYGVYSDPDTREQAFVNMLTTTGLRGPDVVTALTKAGYTMNEINALQREYAEFFQ